MAKRLFYLFDLIHGVCCHHRRRFVEDEILLNYVLFYIFIHRETFLFIHTFFTHPFLSCDDRWPFKKADVKLHETFRTTSNQWRLTNSSLHVTVFISFFRYLFLNLVISALRRNLFLISFLNNFYVCILKFDNFSPYFCLISKTYYDNVGNGGWSIEDDQTKTNDSFYSDKILVN